VGESTPNILTIETAQKTLSSSLCCVSILSAELKIGDGANKKIDIEDSLLDKMWKVLGESFEGICSANLHFP
jgi:hypothetical protein